MEELTSQYYLQVIVVLVVWWSLRFTWAHEGLFGRNTFLDNDDFQTSLYRWLLKQINNSLDPFGAKIRSDFCLRALYLFREANSLSFEEQIYNVQRHVSIRAYFMLNGGYCVYYPSNLFRNTRRFENWGITRIFPSFRWGVFSHLTGLDQSRANENIWWIIINVKLRLTICNLNFFPAKLARVLHNEDNSVFYLGQNTVLYRTSLYDSGSSIAWKTELSIRSVSPLKKEWAKRELSFHANQWSSLKPHTIESCNVIIRHHILACAKVPKPCS